MAKYTALLEQGEDGAWSCYTDSPLAIGVGVTKEAAQEDLRKCLEAVLELARDQGKPVPDSDIELVTVEVVA